MTLTRVVVTGANGAGKTHLANRLHDARPDVPLVHLDALKLLTDWQTRPRAKVEADLDAQVITDAWIIEGGPRSLARIIGRAQCVIWLDPPLWLRTARLLRRAMTARGKTRAELPDGNPDRLWQQIKFGWRSLRADRRFRRAISSTLANCPPEKVLRCRTRAQITHAVAHWSNAGTSCSTGSD